MLIESIGFKIVTHLLVSVREREKDRERRHFKALNHKTGQQIKLFSLPVDG